MGGITGLKVWWAARGMARLKAKNSSFEVSLFGAARVANGRRRPKASGKAPVKIMISRGARPVRGIGLRLTTTMEANHRGRLYHAGVERSCVATGGLDEPFAGSGRACIRAQHT